MANNEYIIRILYETPDGSSVGTAPIASAGNTPGASEAASKAAPTAITTATVLTPMVNAGLQMQTQMINTVTGSGQLARRQSMVNTIAKGTMDAGMSALGGAGVAASLGSALGISTGVGAVIGVAMTAMNKLLDIATAAMDIRNKITVESSAISATKARASISWDRSRGR